MSSAHAHAPLTPTAVSASPEAGCSHEVLLTRHPIFDTGRQTIGYELDTKLIGEVHPGTDLASEICRHTIHQALHVVGLEPLLGQSRLFIPVTPQVLSNEEYMLLPPERTCLKLPPSMPLNETVLASSQKARQAGYTLAIQGDMATDRHWPMFDLAQIIRIDLASMQPEQLHTLLHRKGYSGPSLLAASIDTHEQLDKALQLGVEYVQGFFFSEPQTSTHRALTTPQVIQLRFLSELSKPQLNYETLESIIKSDVALMTHLLRYMNSAAMGIPRRITSVKQALALLGERAVRKWGSLVAITALGAGSPHELLVTSLVRARFCELVANRLHLEAQALDAFLTGLFSTIDVMLHTTMEQALGSLPVESHVRSVLLGDHSSPLGMIYSLVCAAERGAWGSVIELGHKLLLPQQEVAPLYYQTLRWIDEFYSQSAA